MKRPLSSPPTDAGRLLLKGQAYSLCAQLLSPDLRTVAEGGTLEHLQKVLEELGYVDALARLEEAKGIDLSGPGPLDDEYVRLAVEGEVSPYETSYTLKNAPGGTMQQLADISGFYRAFGFQATGERPDHLVPELEFVALLYVKEAYARMTGTTDGIMVCAESRAKFLSQHLLVWLPLFHKQATKVVRHPALVALLSLLFSVVEADQQELATKAKPGRSLA